MGFYIKIFLILNIIFSISFIFNSILYKSLSFKDGLLAPKKIFKYWFLLNFSIFIISNVWFVFFIPILLGMLAGKNNIIRAQIYFVCLFSIPLFSAYVPGFAGISKLLDVSYEFILGLSILLPGIFLLKREEGYKKFGSIKLDYVILLFFIIVLFNEYRENQSSTIVIKQSLVNFFGYYIPYFFFSRFLRDCENLKFIFWPILFIGTFLALESLFEFLKSWRLYYGIGHNIGSIVDLTPYRFRSGHLRVTSIFTQAIIHGYFFIVFLAAAFYIKDKVGIKDNFFKIIFLLLVLGIFTDSSRGPWLGMFIFVFLYTVVFSEKKIKNFIRFCSVLIFGFVGLMAIGQGERIISLLPWIGSSGTSEVDYRNDLLGHSWEVIKVFPLLGSPPRVYLNMPSMLEMIQGEGIIDIVNSYIGLLLNFGFIGFFLYVSVFINFLLFLNKKIKLKQVTLEIKVVSCLLISHLFVIMTVSSLGHLQVFTYILMGIITGLTITPNNIENKLTTRSA